MKPEEIIKHTKIKILEELKEKLGLIKDEEIDFNDIINVWIDAMTPQDRTEALALIDFIGKEKLIDEGLVDSSSMDRMIITTAYAVLEIELYDDDFIQELSNKLNDDAINKSDANKMIKEIEKELKNLGYYTEAGNKKKDKGEAYIDNASQVWVTCHFDISMNDFKDPYFKKEQMIDLSENSIKILTNRNSVNKNAVVLEKIKKDKPFRIYLMDRKFNVDIREYFKGAKYSSIRHGNYSLDPRDYINADMHDFENKEKFIWVINNMVSKLCVID